MIPIRLELKNFMPYQSPEAIYFEGVHLACLTGSNGAGKSSILDAITWALWGKARAKRDEDLIHLGKEEMYVQLDFEQEQQRFRVVRRRPRGKRGNVTVNFFSVGKDGELKTLAEGNIRTTQQKLNDLLRLEYETFINSAFLQQGKADAFTTKTPAERKRILAEILELEEWAVYLERVKEVLKKLDSQIEVYDIQLREFEQELAKKPHYEEEVKIAQVAYEEAEEAATQAQARLDEVSHAPKDLKNAQGQEAAHERRIQELERDLSTVKEDIERHQAQFETYQQMIAQRETIEEGYASLQEARRVQSELSQKLSQLNDLDKRYYDIEKEISIRRSDLEKDRSRYETGIEEWKRVLAQIDESEFEDVQKQIVSMEEIEKRRDALQNQLQADKQENSGIAVTQQTLSDEGQRLKDRLKKLQDADGAVCPLCGQPLTEEHRDDLIQQITAEVDAKRDDYKETQTKSIELQAAIQSAKVEVQEMTGQLQQLPLLRQQMGRLTEKHQQSSDAQIKLDKGQANLDEVLKVLEEESFSADLREQLREIEEQRQQLGDVKDSHSETEEKLQQYQMYERQQAELQLAEQSLPHLQQTMEGSQIRYERLEKAIADEQSELEGIRGEIEQLKVLVQEEQVRRNELSEKRIQSSNAHERLITARQELGVLESLAERKLEREALRDKCKYDEAIYQELRVAFGKDGVPAMVIEHAIPELESTSNELLARMTDGRMNLRITTQREKVTGGISETLDIEIADELGTRNYEMYSGGEAFRINFAVRVALSKMLARRSGAHLRTLFIDEGFGSQDADGRDKLVEAIIAIQDEFDLILVITHIEELRDSFPVHIVVEKSREGSLIRLQ